MNSFQMRRTIGIRRDFIRNSREDVTTTIRNGYFTTGCNCDSDECKCPITGTVLFQSAVSQLLSEEQRDKRSESFYIKESMHKPLRDQIGLVSVIDVDKNINGPLMPYRRHGAYLRKLHGNYQSRRTWTRQLPGETPLHYCKMTDQGVSVYYNYN